MLSRLCTWETILYCTAKVLIALGILYASIQYRPFSAQEDVGLCHYGWRYCRLNALVRFAYVFDVQHLLGWVCRFPGVGPEQDADIGESAALQAAALQKSAAAQANTQASQRFAESTRKGSLWGQVNTAKDASRNADESATLGASRAAALKRDAGVTEQQVLALVSPWKPLPTMMVTAGMVRHRAGAAEPAGRCRCCGLHRQPLGGWQGTRRSRVQRGALCPPLPAGGAVPRADVSTRTRGQIPCMCSHRHTAPRGQDVFTTDTRCTCSPHLSVCLRRHIRPLVRSRMWFTADGYASDKATSPTGTGRARAAPAAPPSRERPRQCRTVGQD